MRNRAFSSIFAALLLVLPPAAHADLSLAKDVEEKRVHFDTAQSQLSPDSKIILDQAISLLARMNESYSLKVVGYTDAQGSEEINQDLSMQRANTVANYLISKGIDRNRVLIQGLGHENPVATNDEEEGRMRNRRVEFKFITPDTSNLTLTASTEMVAASEPKEQEIIEIKPAEEAQPAPVPVVEAKPEPKTAPKPEQEIQPEEELRSPAVVSERRKDTMLATEKKHKTPHYTDHIYEDRKRADAGQSYIQITPMITTLDGLSGLGATDDRLNSKVSFRGEAGWISFLDDMYESYVIAKAYGSFIRFAQDGPTLIAERQREFTYGGELGVGRYFHPNISLQIAAGYGAELMYRSSGGNIELDNEFMGHLAFTVEAVVWRFSKDGDIGLEGSFMYYDIGRGIMETGSGYNLNAFLDYDFLRAGLGFTMQNFETTTYDYSVWTFGPNIRLYF